MGWACSNPILTIRFSWVKSISSIQYLKFEFWIHQIQMGSPNLIEFVCQISDPKRLYFVQFSTEVIDWNLSRGKSQRLNPKPDWNFELSDTETSLDFPREVSVRKRQFFLLPREKERSSASFVNGLGFFFCVYGTVYKLARWEKKSRTWAKSGSD